MKNLNSDTDKNLLTKKVLLLHEQISHCKALFISFTFGTKFKNALEVERNS